MTAASEAVIAPSAVSEATGVVVADAAVEAAATVSVVIAAIALPKAVPRPAQASPVRGAAIGPLTRHLPAKDRAGRRASREKDA